MLGLGGGVRQPDVHVVPVFTQARFHDLLHAVEDAFVVEKTNRQGFQLDRRAHECQPGFTVDGQPDRHLDDGFSFNHFPFF